MSDQIVVVEGGRRVKMVPMLVDNRNMQRSIIINYANDFFGIGQICSMSWLSTWYFRFGLNAIFSVFGRAIKH